MLLPILGLVPTLGGMLRASGAGREEAKRALRWQLLGTSILVLHLVLQVGVVAIDWLATELGTVPPQLQTIIRPLLLLISAANVGSGIVEYCFVAFWGLRAARGAPLPFLDGERR